MASRVDWPWVRRIVAITVTILVIGLALIILDWSRLAATLRSMPVSAIVMCLLFSTLSQCVVAFRWSVLTAPPGGRPSVLEMLLSFHSGLFNLVTPGGLGADVFRVLQSRQHDRLRSHSAGLVVFERLLGVWAQAATYLAGLSFVLVTQAIVPSIMVWAGVAFVFGAVVIMALVFGAAPLLYRLVAGRQNRFVVLIANLLKGGMVVGLGRRMAILALSVVAVVLWVAASATLSQGANLTLSFPQVTMITVLTEFARLLPLSIQGIGVREATYAWLASLNGGSPESAFVVCGLLYALNLLVIMLTGSIAAAVSMRISASRRMEMKQ